MFLKKFLLIPAIFILLAGCATVSVETSLPGANREAIATVGEVFFDIRSEGPFEGKRTVITLVKVDSKKFVLESAEYVKGIDHGTKLAIGGWKLREGILKKYEIPLTKKRFRIKTREFEVYSVGDGIVTYRVIGKPKPVQKPFTDKAD